MLHPFESPHMKSSLALGVFTLFTATSVFGGDLAFSDPAQLPPPPKHAVGYPSRSPQLDALPGFVKPPPGYGEVAFYWWIGEPLTQERLSWQLDKLSNHHISGLQINYCHDDAPGWPSVPSDPPVFTPEWWSLCKWFSGEAKARGMAISLSDYTLGGPGQGQWTSQTIAEHPEARGQLLENVETRVQGGKSVELDLIGPPPGNPQSKHRVSVVGAMAYRLENGKIVAGSALDLGKQISGKVLKWQAPEGSDWRINATVSSLVPVSIDPMNPISGAGIIQRLFDRFEKNLPGEAGKGLNFFFSDELVFGLRGNLWNAQFAQEFRKRKGYDLLPELPALFTNIGPRTEKVRLDYYDVMTSLTEAGYFKPVFNWHHERGMILGCDHGGRGRDITEFGDYFRTQRWNSGPGNDSPHLGSELIKNKVSSSIAHLYERQRTWNEGYYSSGWGTSTANLVDALYRNMSMGHTLLTLHGLYYTTYGGFWEWAPPCNHFRMPYWDHLKEHQAMSERVSYLLSQGVHRCDVAILYPVAALEAEGKMSGGRSPDTTPGINSVSTAFGIAKYLNEKGIDFDFMDFESLTRAKIESGQLRVAGERYRILVLPAMQALRFETLQKALEFQRAGGIVIAQGALPSASDRAGRDDAQLDAMVKELFGATANAPVPAKPSIVRSKTGGQGVWSAQPGTILEVIDQSFPRDFALVETGDRPGVKAPMFLHRKIGPREVYMVYGAPRGSTCFFRAQGSVELWDQWTGKTRPLHVISASEKGTQVRMPLDANEAQLIVFNPATPAALTVEKTDLDEVTGVSAKNGVVEVRGFAATEGPKRAGSGPRSAVVKLGAKTVTLTGSATVQKPLALEGDWEFELVPTMDNRFGDFRLPPSNTFISAEARFFKYQDETAPNPGWEKPAFNDSSWPKVTQSFGQRFWKLGPLPEKLPAEVEAQLAALKQIDPAQPVKLGGKEYRWQPYDISWRWGKEGDPGHQGWHGLKKNVTDEFLCLGKPGPGHNETKYLKEDEGTQYYLWTSAYASKPTDAVVDAAGLTPAALYLNGASIDKSSTEAKLQPGSNPLLVRYDAPGRGHLVLLDKAAPKQAATLPLAMRWFTQPGVIPLDTRPQDTAPAGWYRFNAAPGLRSMTITTSGKLSAWADGTPLAITEPKPLANGAREYTVRLAKPAEDLVPVALRIEQERGCYGGAAIQEPVKLDCGPGKMPLGDWAKTGALECYSGGAWYRKTVTLAPEQTQGRVMLNLGSVAASAEIRVNGKSAGIRVAPPWAVDISALVKSGENRIEVLVYNTLANHYLTIPTLYRGPTVSGLIGPVTIEPSMPVTLHN